MIEYRLFALSKVVLATALGFLLLTAAPNQAAEPATNRRSDARQDSRPSIDLSGEWEFKLDPLDVGRAEKWFDPQTPYDKKVRVPGAWNTQGIAFESEKELRDYEEGRLSKQKSSIPSSILGEQRESERVIL